MGVDGDGGANPIGCKYTQHSHDIRTVLKQHLNNLFVHVAKGADISSSLNQEVPPPLLLPCPSSFATTHPADRPHPRRLEQTEWHHL